MSEKVGSYGAHEALDRMFLICDMFSGYVMEHPFIEENKELFEQAEKISDEMFDMYNRIANLYFDKFEEVFENVDRTPE
jgi:hypothetical protein